MPNNGLFQIFYDTETQKNLDKNFTPLDNTENLHPDLFETWPIVNFLRNTPLEEDKFYAFFSPNLKNKTTIKTEHLDVFLTTNQEYADIVLFQHSVDQICFFKNCFEQGEFWHPGLKAEIENFIIDNNIRLDISSYVGHTYNTIYSNYFAAKPKIWKRWLKLAETLIPTQQQEEGNRKISFSDNYYKGKTTSNRVFLAERIINIILATENYKTISIPNIDETSKLFNQESYQILSACNTLKIQYDLSKAPCLLEAFFELQKQVKPQN